MRITQMINILLLLFILTYTSCSDGTFFKNKKSEIEEKNNYSPEFNPLKKSYIRNKKRVIKSFYKNELKRRFNGQFLVAKNGKVLYETFNGFSNYKSKEKINFKTPLHLASVSKTATSIAIMRLVDQKKLLLNEDIRNYIPEIPYEGISVRMLLNHRSGIPYYGYFTYGIWPLEKTLTKCQFNLKWGLNLKIAMLHETWMGQVKVGCKEIWHDVLGLKVNMPLWNFIQIASKLYIQSTT